MLLHFTPRPPRPDSLFAGQSLQTCLAGADRPCTPIIYERWRFLKISSQITVTFAFHLKPHEYAV